MTTKRYAALMAALLFLPLVSNGQSSPKNSLPARFPADAVDQVSLAIVQVSARFTAQIRLPDGTLQNVNWNSGGTGFLLDNQGRVATAEHIVSLRSNRTQLEQALGTKMTLVPESFRLDALPVAPPPLNIEKDAHGNEFSNINTFHRAAILKEDALLDIAFLDGDPRLLTYPDIVIDGQAAMQPRQVPRFQAMPPRAGDSISVSGFPAVHGFEGGIPSIVTNNGIVSSVLFKDERGRWVYLTDLHSNQGDSGGPVFNSSSGEIIGFVDGYYPATNGENSGLTVVIPIRQILDCLRSADKQLANRE